MKNFTNIFMIAMVLTLVFSACKYDEGPGISFRQKRERLSNGWIVTNYKIDGTDDAVMKGSFSHGDSLELVFAIYQAGNYALNLQYTSAYAAATNWNKYFVANNTGAVQLYFDYNKNSFFQRVGSQGRWTFDKKHSDVLFGAYDLSYSAGENKILRCEIIMLKNKMLKLAYTSLDGKKHLITFEPRN